MRKTLVFAVVMLTLVVGGAFVVEGQTCAEISKCRQVCENDNVRVVNPCMNEKIQQAQEKRAESIREGRGDPGNPNSRLSEFNRQCRQEVGTDCRQKCGDNDFTGLYCQ